MSVFQLVFSYLEATVVGLLEAARCQSSSSGGGEAFKWGRGRRFLLNFREITWNLMILYYRNTEKYKKLFTWYWLLKGSGTGERPSIKWGQTTEWCLANKIGWWRVPDIVIEMTAVFQIQGKTSENTKMKQTQRHLSRRNTLTVKQH